jgi:hypothetical protein
VTPAESDVERTAAESDVQRTPAEVSGGGSGALERRLAALAAHLSRLLDAR